MPGVEVAHRDVVRQPHGGAVPLHQVGEVEPAVGAEHERHRVAGLELAQVGGEGGGRLQAERAGARQHDLAAAFHAVPVVRMVHLADDGRVLPEFQHGLSHQVEVRSEQGERPLVRLRDEAGDLQLMDFVGQLRAVRQRADVIDAVEREQFLGGVRGVHRRPVRRVAPVAAADGSAPHVRAVDRLVHCACHSCAERQQRRHDDFLHERFPFVDVEFHDRRSVLFAPVYQIHSPPTSPNAVNRAWRQGPERTRRTPRSRFSSRNRAR